MLVYVDDLLLQLCKLLCSFLIQALQEVWKTSGPAMLGVERLTTVRFLGMDLQIPDVVTSPGELLMNRVRSCFTSRSTRPRCSRGSLKALSRAGRHPEKQGISAPPCQGESPVRGYNFVAPTAANDRSTVAADYPDTARHRLGCERAGKLAEL